MKDKYLNRKVYKDDKQMVLKKALILPLVFLLSIFLVNALDTEYTFKLAPTISIERPCFSANGWCSPIATCYLKITDPDNVVIVSNGNMTNQVSFHNFTVSNITKTGIYKADMVCSDFGVSGFNSFYFGVNDAGFDYRGNNGVAFILGILIVLMILFGVASFYLSDGLRLAFLILTFLMLPITLWVALNIVKNSFMGSVFVNILSWSFGISLVGFFGIVLYVLTTLIMTLKVSKNPGQPELGANYGSTQFRNRRNSREER